tara:strand:+ start:397 stop:819 length:423 start_codon:yes stop_codon:yes gene_type:complete
MGKIHIENSIISSSGNYGLYHGTTQIKTITSAGVQVTGSLFASSSDAVSDLFKIGKNYLYASSSGQIGIGTTSTTALLEISGSNDRDFLIIRSGSLKGLTINSEGVLVVGTFTNSNVPTAVSGGLYYNSSENAFFLTDTS